MCGRYVLKAALPEIARMLGIDIGANMATALEPRYNIAPTTTVPICRMRAADERELALVRWGLVPQWAKSADGNYRMINARAETVAEKPAFRTPLRSRRCLVPADGYYEWKSIEGRKQPYFFSMQDGAPFCFAGLWERWQPAEGDALETCTIITTDANALGAEVHHRMPVILAHEDHDRWLDPGTTKADEVLPLLTPFPAEAMSVYPVSTIVNNARSDGADCIAPLGNPGGHG